MADRTSQAAARLTQFTGRQSNPSPDRRSILSDRSNVSSDRRSFKNLRMSYVAARQSVISNARSSRSSRQSLQPQPPGKLKQIRQAKEMEQAVNERAKRLKVDPPGYEFLEMIGKGSFGRVYKSRKTSDKSIVSVKIIDVDSADYKLTGPEKDQAIEDFKSETNILSSLHSRGAKNVNNMLDAFNFFSQLWIVTEYCPGGSVHTLMKAWDGGRLEEQHIIAIARELAEAVKAVHDVNIIHRDIKAANVLIREDGAVQLCDFGVAAPLESKMSKRQTFIGTPYWMAPEMYDPSGISMRGGYGREVDIWAYGCTIYEMATGQAPNVTIKPDKLHLFLKKPPQLEGTEYSDALKAFVAHCLVIHPDERPNADGVVTHPYIKDTQQKYPTSSLKELMKRYSVWEISGGERASLLNPFGAQAPEALPDFRQDDEWNFSMTDEYVESMIEELVQEEERSQSEVEEALSSHVMENPNLERWGYKKYDTLFTHKVERYGFDDTDVHDPNTQDDVAELIRNERPQSVIDLDLDLNEMEMSSDSSAMHSKRESVGDFYGNVDDGYEDDKDFYGSSHDDYDPNNRPYYDNNDPDKSRNVAEWKFPSAQDTSITDQPNDSTEVTDFNQTPIDDMGAPGPADDDFATHEYKFPASTPPHDDQLTPGMADMTLSPSKTKSMDKRKTLEWTMASAPYMNDEGTRTNYETTPNLQQSGSAEGFATSSRPGLKHTATAPSGEIFGNPRDRSTASLDFDANTGVIDPSSGSPTGDSYDEFSPYESHNDEPFGLEDNEPVKNKGKNRFDPTSLSQSEPNPEVDEETMIANVQQGIEEYKKEANTPIPPHVEGEDRRAMLEQQMSDRLERVEGLEAALTRGPSVKASADYLRRDDDDDDDDHPSPGARRAVTPAASDKTSDSNATIRGPAQPPKLNVNTDTIKRAPRVSTLSRTERRNIEKWALKDPKRVMAMIPDVKSVNPAALKPGAPKEVVVDELRRLLRGLNKALDLVVELCRLSREWEEKQAKGQGQGPARKKKGKK